MQMLNDPPSFFKRPSTLVALVVLGGLITAAAIVVYTGRANYVSVIGALFNRVAADGGVRVMPAISYGTGSRRVLDVYKPLRSSKRNPAGYAAAEKAPIVLFLYGGSWQQGDRGQYRFVGTSLAKRGLTVVIPDYRLYPSVRFPKFMDDAADAYRWVWVNLAIQKTGPPRPIIVMGHSAGANMAALLTLDTSYLAKRNPGMAKPAALIGLAGPYAFDPTTTASVKDVFHGLKNSDEARPIAFVKEGAPPTLLLHGTGDETVKLTNMRDFAKALETAGDQVEQHELDGIGHMGLLTAIAKPLRWRAPVLDIVTSFLVKNGLLTLPKKRAPVAVTPAAQPSTAAGPATHPDVEAPKPPVTP